MSIDELVPRQLALRYAQAQSDIAGATDAAVDPWTSLVSTILDKVNEWTAQLPPDQNDFEDYVVKWPNELFGRSILPTTVTFNPYDQMFVFKCDFTSETPHARPRKLGLLLQQECRRRGLLHRLQTRHNEITLEVHREPASVLHNSDMAETVELTLDTFREQAELALEASIPEVQRCLDQLAQSTGPVHYDVGNGRLDEGRVLYVEAAHEREQIKVTVQFAMPGINVKKKDVELVLQSLGELNYPQLPGLETRFFQSQERVVCEIGIQFPRPTSTDRA